jgi:hypothetical protein
MVLDINSSIVEITDKKHVLFFTAVFCGNGRRGSIALFDY